jgi:hypothetical protein
MLMPRRVLAATSLALLARRARAQAVGDRRVALVIGNGAYRDGIPALANPPRDARAIAAALRECGFRVELRLDAQRDEMLAAIQRLGAGASGSEGAMLFYAGHAMEVGGRNVLLPVSVGRPGSDGDALIRRAVPFDAVSAALEGRARATLIFLDACRDNPFAAAAPAAVAAPPRPRGGGGTRSVGGLASVRSSSGTLIAFATAPGQVALDGTGENSPFTTALLQHIRTPGLEAREMLARTRRAVREATGGEQIPWDNSSLEAPFYFFVARGEAAGVAAGRVGRATTVAAEQRGMVLPPDVDTLTYRRNGTEADRFLGTWVSTAGWNNGAGRHEMLIVLRADSAAGTAFLIQADGPPTAQSRGRNPPAWYRRTVPISQGRLEWVSQSGAHYSFRLRSAAEMEGAVQTGPGNAAGRYRVTILLRRVDGPQ